LVDLFADTTLRDGEQSPGATLYLKEKLVIARQLRWRCPSFVGNKWNVFITSSPSFVFPSKLGVDVCEAGFPIASEGDYDAVKAVAEEVRGLLISALSKPANFHRNTADLVGTP